jgi:hypothetical protein
MMVEAFSEVASDPAALVMVNVRGPRAAAVEWFEKTPRHISHTFQIRI